MLRKAMASALDQSWQDMEVLVSDNASTDGTTDVVASFGDRVRYNRNATNIGSWPNFVKLVETASGDYFAFLQDDDLLHRDFASRAVAAFSRSPEIVVYATYSVMTPSTTTFYFPKLYGPPVALDWLRSEVRVMDGILVPLMSLFFSVANPPAIAFRTDVVRRAIRHIIPECALFNERILLSFAAVEGKVAIDPWLSSVYLSHDDQEHRKTWRDDPGALSRQWSTMATAICELIKEHPENWESPLTQIFLEATVGQRLDWMEETYTLADAWETAPSVAQRVRTLLLDTLPQHVKDPIVNYYKYKNIKQLISDLSPPILLRAAKKLKRF